MYEESDPPGPRIVLQGLTTEVAALARDPRIADEAVRIAWSLPPYLRQCAQVNGRSGVFMTWEQGAALAGISVQSFRKYFGLVPSVTLEAAGTPWKLRRRQDGSLTDGGYASEWTVGGMPEPYLVLAESEVGDYETVSQFLEPDRSSWRSGAPERLMWRTLVVMLVKYGLVDGIPATTGAIARLINPAEATTDSVRSRAKRVMKAWGAHPAAPLMLEGGSHDRKVNLALFARHVMDPGEGSPIASWDEVERRRAWVQSYRSSDERQRE